MVNRRAESEVQRQSLGRKDGEAKCPLTAHSYFYNPRSSLRSHALHTRDHCWTSLQEDNDVSHIAH